MQAGHETRQCQKVVFSRLMSNEIHDLKLHSGMKNAVRSFPNFPEERGNEGH